MIAGRVVKFEPQALTLDDGTGPARIFFPAELPWRRPYVNVGEFWAAQGVVGQYAFEAPWEGGYRVIPRFKTDVSDAPLVLPVTGGRVRKASVSTALSQPPAIVYAGLDESGSLTAESPFFVMAAVITAEPRVLHHLIPRAVTRSGKRLGRSAKDAGEIKWRNASRRIRALVLAELAAAEVELFTLTVLKGGRRIEDTPENYGILACELLSLFWPVYPNVALAIDRHFTSPAQVATVNTWIYRRWPPPGVLSIVHADSQRNTLVQLADMVAGSVYAWHKSGDRRCS